ncbi:protein SRG1-like isoform X2 [Salvia splendens]|uniref:protein SRG1-like isoform X2 n=1 Tax=Salvia splendens TaxID=180675 RepID=UPI001103B208|nr:protein SRG1-like isoform X2 [Salvia splendens]
MAETKDLPEEAAIFGKTAHQLSKTGYGPPESYIWTNKIEIDAPLATDIPVIDVSLLASSSDAELTALHSALTKWGCFQAVNHGIESASLDEMRLLITEFFHLPELEKQRYTREGNDIEGYSSCPPVARTQKFEWSDRLHLQVAPEDGRKLKFWPQNPEPFRKVLEDYSAKIRHVEEQIFRAIAKTLSLTDEDCFVKKMPTLCAQFNYYPPCSKHDQVIGLRPHTDGTGITLLLQDSQVRGLQILKDNQWLSVPIIPQALFVLPGDQLELMSNGIFKSTWHRVVINSEAERISVAMFFFPDIADEIGPLDQLVDEERPKMFNKVTNYKGGYYNYYHQEKRGIDALKI